MNLINILKVINTLFISQSIHSFLFVNNRTINIFIIYDSDDVVSERGHPIEVICVSHEEYSWSAGKNLYLE